MSGNELGLREPSPMVGEVYTVLELNSAVRALIKLEFPNYIWVCGEIQGLKPEGGKRHTYFELVQKHSEADEIIAKVRVALFANRKPVVFQRIQETEGAFELKNDIEVKFLCEVSLHPPTGQYSLIAVDIDPVYTLGKFAQNRLKIIEFLKKRGLLDKNKLHQIPPVALNIGLITASDSAAYHDFINELSLSGYGFRVFVYNSYMQGKNVEADVIKALRYFDKHPSELDLIVITRGGGSRADLSWFDNKNIAEAVASSRFPILSALGHQTDTSITDMVAHTFCKTPTKAAQFLVEKVRSFMESLDYLQENIIKKGENIISSSKGGLQAKTVKLESVSSRYFRFHREELLEKKHLVVNSLGVYLSDKKNQLKGIFENLNFCLDRRFENYHKYIKHTQDKVKLLNPKTILKRGYSITSKGKRAVKSINEIEEADELRTVLYDGSFISRVRSKSTA